MRHHPAHDVSRTYRSVFILLGRAALRADQHVHLLFPPVMRVQCANRTDSSTQHQRYHLLSAATLNNSRNRNFVHRKDHGRIEAGIPGSPRPHRRRRSSRSDFGERCSSWLVATAAEDRLIPAQSETSFAAAWRSMRVSLGWRSHTWRALTSTPASPRTRTPYLSRTVASR